MNKKVVQFNKKNLIFTIIFLLVALSFCLFQLIIMWFAKFTFSFNLVPQIKKEIWNKIFGVIILCFMIFSISFFIFKSFSIYKRKFFFKNDKLFLSFIFLITIMHFLIPSSIPMNYVVPVLFLFFYVSYKYQFTN